MQPHELEILMSSLEKVKLERESSSHYTQHNPSQAPPPPPSAKKPATMTTRDEVPEEAIEIIEKFRKVVSSSAHNQPGVKEELLELCYKMETILESPDDFIQKLRAEPTRYTAVKIGIDLGIFEMIGENAITAADLAGKCEADELVVSRILKHLATTNIVAEVGENMYKATPLSVALADQDNKATINFSYEVVNPIFQSLPGYLAMTGYASDPNTAINSFQFAHKTHLKMFPWLQNHPQHLANFQAMMDSRYTNPRTWFDVYPIKERLISGLAAYMDIQPRPTKDSDVLLVDIGGSTGSDLLRFIDYLNELWIGSSAKMIERPAGRIRFILQDLPDVLENVDSDVLKNKPYKISSLFECQSHDFFYVNPVKGARAYYMHAVLRDFDDDDCAKILVNIRKSMKMGWSRLLLQEWVIPNAGANFRATRTDMAMMALNARKERTARQWEKLLVLSGLKIVEIYEIDRGFESLIEAELA